MFDFGIQEIIPIGSWKSPEQSWHWEYLGLMVRSGWGTRYSEAARRVPVKGEPQAWFIEF